MTLLNPVTPTHLQQCHSTGQGTRGCLGRKKSSLGRGRKQIGLFGGASHSQPWHRQAVILDTECLWLWLHACHIHKCWTSCHCCVALP